MYNYVMLMGKVCDDVSIYDYKDQKKCAFVNLVVQREFRDADGKPLFDRITVKCWNAMAEVAKETIKKDTKIAIKGRIVPTSYVAGGKTHFSYDIVADRFLFV